jgi:hypothetical protein
MIKIHLNIKELFGGMDAIWVYVHPVPVCAAVDMQMYTSWFPFHVVLKHRLVKAVSSVINSVSIPMRNLYYVER